MLFLSSTCYRLFLAIADQRLYGRKGWKIKVIVALGSCAGSLPLLEGSVVKSVIFGVLKLGQ